MKCCCLDPLEIFFPLWVVWIDIHFSVLFFFLDRVDISEVPEEGIDQVAVLTSNVLFFIVMFIFAVFETYVFHSEFLRSYVSLPSFSFPRLNTEYKSDNFSEFPPPCPWTCLPGREKKPCSTMASSSAALDLNPF